jgi:2-polyprenyl-3-methyl-5-hydroxy-6-metoxy-1,4-benzoquinol methylase
MKNNCIVCGAGFNEEVLNELPMRRCTVCSLLWRKDFNVDLSHYVEDNITFKNTDEASLKRKYKNAKERAKAYSKYLSLDNICDVGTGRGFFLRALIDLRHKNVIGLEPNKYTELVADEQGVRIIQGGFDDLKKVVSENNIKTVSLFHVIEHLPDPVVEVKKIFEALPPGGHTIIETPNASSYPIVARNYKHKLVYPEHLFLFNPESLKRLLEKEGFKIIAQGTRDFDQNNLPIKESLFRLGIIKKPTMQKERRRLGDPNWKPIDDKENNIEKRRSLLKRVADFFLIYTLSLLVRWRGRLTFIWYVAEKPAQS